MARPVPVWTGVVDGAGVFHLDAIGLFRRYARTFANQRVRITVTRETRGKSRHQLGYLFGVLYPIIAEDLGYGDYEVSQLHDACMRELRGLQPEPNPLQLRVSLAAMSQDEVSRYIDDLRQWALDTHGIVTPDADLAEVA